MAETTLDLDLVDYAPQSPDLSGETPYEPDAFHPQHQRYRASISVQSPYTPVDGPGRKSSYFGQQAALIAEQQAQLKEEEMADDDDYVPDSKPLPASRSKRRAVKQEDVGNGSAAEIEVRTKFPVARIKRIMQADEDVGKVAQVTPVAVSKALELFMISMVTKAAAEARSRSSKRVLPTHLKQVVLQNDQFDFLNEIVGKIADAPAAAKHEDSDEEGGKKKKTASRRKRKGSEDV